MKTLFNPPTDVHTDRDNSVSYALVPDIKMLKIGKHNLMVNPKLGSWVILEGSDSSTLDLSENHAAGEFLYQKGLCKRNNSEPAFFRTSEYTEEMYFFEFFVTSRCNLFCTYCFAQADRNAKDTDSDATLEMAELFVDRIAEFRVKTHSRIPFIIEFTGGEPLLNFDVLKHTIEYVKKQYGDILNVKFTMQSNITCLTTEQLEFLKREKVGIGISCDGFKDIQNSQRPFRSGLGSYCKLVKNLSKVRELYPDNSRTAITVITKKSQDVMPELFLYLYLQGFNEISLRPMIDIGRGCDSISGYPDTDKYVKGLFDILDNVIEPLYKEYGIIVREQHLSLTFQHLLNPHRPVMYERSPCGGGTNICIVMPNGDVYPCNQSAGEESLFMGNIKEKSLSDVIKSKAAKIIKERTPSLIEECKDCVFMGWCNSPCAVAALRKNGTINSKSAYCEILRKRYQLGLERLIEGSYDPFLIGKLADLNYPVDWDSFATV